ncbi:hypothetical protein [Corynebacterium auriscanis]|uniref:hypothetical protein n=1 Tax=Corynebacterium auriscanis TaxID=99807 RepID=UPI003CEBA5E9
MASHRKERTASTVKKKTDYPRELPMRRFVNHLLPTVFMGFVMTVAYLAGFHQPQPHHVPVGIVGQGPESAQVAEKLQGAFGDKADVRTYPTEGLAEAALKRAEVAGAFVPGGDEMKLMTAPAYSETLNNVVLRMFYLVASKAHQPMTVQEVVPLDSHDAAGQNSFFFLVVLSVSGYALGIAMSVAGATYSYRKRVALILPAALFVVTVEFAFARWAMHMFEGHGWAVWALAMGYFLIVLAVTVGLHPIVGRWSGFVYSAMFVGLNFTSSGGVFEPVLQPAFFGWLHQFWVGSGFVQSIRHILYFPGSETGNGFGILTGWAVAAVLMLVIGGVWERANHLKYKVLTYEQAQLEEDVVA